MIKVLKKLSKIKIVVLAGCLICTGSAVNAQVKTSEKVPELIKTERVEGLWEFNTNEGLSLNVAGGYFVPKGSVASVLDPTWITRISLQDNQKGGSSIGMGLDFSYTSPPDKEIDGGLTFYSLMPTITSTFAIYNWFDVQIKPGLGISMIDANVRGSDSFSTDLTVQFGAGIQRLLFKHLVVGIDGCYFYYFERSSFSAYSLNFSLGYRF